MVQGYRLAMLLTGSRAMCPVFQKPIFKTSESGVRKDLLIEKVPTREAGGA